MDSAESKALWWGSHQPFAETRKLLIDAATLIEHTATKFGMVLGTKGISPAAVESIAKEMKEGCQQLLSLLR